VNGTAELVHGPIARPDVREAAPRLTPSAVICCHGDDGAGSVAHWQVALRAAPLPPAVVSRLMGQGTARAWVRRPGGAQAWCRVMDPRPGPLQAVPTEAVAATDASRRAWGCCRPCGWQVRA